VLPRSPSADVVQQILEIMLKCEILKYCCEVGLIMCCKDLRDGKLRNSSMLVWGADMQRPEH